MQLCPFVDLPRWYHVARLRLSWCLERNVAVLEDTGTDNSPFQILIGMQRLLNSFISTQLFSWNLEIPGVPQEHLRKLSSQGRVFSSGVHPQACVLGYPFFFYESVFAKRGVRASLQLHL